MSGESASISGYSGKVIDLGIGMGATDAAATLAAPLWILVHQRME